MKVEKLTLGDICDFVGGSQPPKSEFSSSEKPGYVRLIQTRDYKTDSFLTYIPESSTKKFCDEKDIMIGRYGPPIFQILRGLKGAYNVALMKAIPNEKVENEYLYYYLTQDSLFEYIDALSLRTGGQTGVDVKMLKQYPILLPEKSYQRKVQEILVLLDAKIELNNKINAQLEAMAKLIYDYWFVQFEFPSEALVKDGTPQPYKSSGGKMVYNDELKREIPEGWEVKTVSEIADTGSGGTPLKSKKEFYEGGHIPWINSGEVNNPFLIAAEKFISDEGLSESSAKLFPEGTILMAMYGATAGEVSIIDFEACTNQAICAIMPKENKYQGFLKFGLELIYEYLVSLSSGSARDNLSQDKIKNLKFAVPFEDVLEDFQSHCKTSFQQIFNNLRQNQELSALRDWLLPMLMNGQVTVGEAKEKVEQMSVAAEPKATYSKKSPKKSGEKEDKHFVKRKVLASYIINQSAEDPKFGETKFEKLLHLADYHAIQRNLGQKYIQKAAGPYDNSFTFPFFQQTVKANWFRKEQNGTLNRILPGQNNSKSQNTYGLFSPEELKKVDELLQKFKDSNYEQPEIISTLYAVWNNRLVKGEPITDKLLKQDFLNWDKQKAKYKDRLDNALKWMRENGIVPNGWGEVISRAKTNVG